MKEELEVIASWFTIVVAAAYTFTVGYLDVLKVPINPSPIDAFSFYLRATLLSDHGFQGVLRVFGPLAFFIIFIKGFRFLKNLDFFKRRWRGIALNSSTFLVGVAVICYWSAQSFDQGRKSLSTSEAGSYFPKASRSAKNKANDSELKEYRLAWISDGQYFWLDCDPAQPQLIGVESDVEIFVRRLGPDANTTICK